MSTGKKVHRTTALPGSKSQEKYQQSQAKAPILTPIENLIPSLEELESGLTPSNGLLTPSSTNGNNSNQTPPLNPPIFGLDVSHKQDIAPKRGKPPTATAGGLSPKHRAIALKLAEVYSGIGMLSMGVSTELGILFILHSEERATEVVKVARHHPPLMKLLERLLDSNDYLALIIGHGSMFLGLAAYKGLLPDVPVVAGFKASVTLDLKKWGEIMALSEAAYTIPE